MANEERVYTIPVRRAWLKVRREGRSDRTVNYIREFLEKHMKTEDVKVSPKLNDLIWKRGNSKPPGKIKVRVRVADGVAMARLMDEVFVEKKAEPKKGLEGLKEKVTGFSGGAKPAAEPAKEGAEKPENKGDEKGAGDQGKKT